MKFCPNCGAPLQPGVKFCSVCGQKLVSNTQEAPAQPDPQSYTPPRPYVQPQNYNQSQGGNAQSQGYTQSQNYNQSQSGYTPTPAYSGSVPYGANTEPQKPPKKKSKGLLWALLSVAAVLVIAIILLLVLAFSGGNSDDANLGMYNVIACEYMGVDINAYDEWLELKSGNRATIMIDGDEFSCRWSLDGEDFTLKQGGDTFEGTLRDGVLTLDIADVLYTYLKEGAVIDDAQEETPEVPEVPVLDEPVLETEDPEVQEPVVSGEFSSELAVWDECNVRIAGAEHFLDADGEDAIRIYYDYTNTSDTTAYAYSIVEYYVEQDGYEQMDTYASYEDDVPEYGNDTRYVRPGVTLRCILEYSMKMDGGNVEVLLYNYWNEDQYVTASFNPQNLPGRPEDLEVERYADPQWMDEFSDIGVYNEEYEVYIDRAEIVEGINGEDLLRVYFDFTNNSDEAESFLWATYVYAFQDGIEMLEGIPEDSVTEDDNYYEEVAPGETISVAMCFVLDGDNPVEVQFINDDENADIIAAIFSKE